MRQTETEYSLMTIQTEILYHMNILQVYLSLYTTVESMVNQITTGAVVCGDSLSLSGFKVMFMFLLYNCSFFFCSNLSLNCFLLAVYLPLVVTSDLVWAGFYDLSYKVL